MSPCRLLLLLPRCWFARVWACPPNATAAASPPRTSSRFSRRSSAVAPLGKWGVAPARRLVLVPPRQLARGPSPRRARRPGAAPGPEACAAGHPRAKRIAELERQLAKVTARPAARRSDGRGSKKSLAALGDRPARRATSLASSTNDDHRDPRAPLRHHGVVHGARGGPGHLLPAAAPAGAHQPRRRSLRALTATEQQTGLRYVWPITSTISIY